MPSDRRYKQLYFLLFAPFALQTAFMNLYFERRGLTHGEIGTLGAISSAISIASPLFFGYLADRLRHKRPVLLWVTIGSALLMPAHYLAATWPALVALTVGLALCRSPMVPLTDALCLDELHATGDPKALRYADIRVWGSLGFIVCGTLVPLLLPSEALTDPIRRLAPVFLAMLVFGLGMAWRNRTLGDPAVVETPLGYDEPADSLFAVLRVPRLKRLTVLLFFGWMANSVYYLFLSLYLQDIGVRDSLKGAYWSMGVVGEVLFMLLGSRILARLGVRRVLLLGLVGRSFRLMALSWRLPPLVVLLVVQPFHALAFGAVHLGTIAFVARTVPDRQRAAGQTVLASLVSGVGGVLGSYLAGWVSDASKAGQLLWLTHRTGVYAAFWVGGWLHVLTTLAAIWLLREPEEPAV